TRPPIFAADFLQIQQTPSGDATRDCRRFQGAPTLLRLHPRQGFCNNPPSRRRRMNRRRALQVLGIGGAAAVSAPPLRLARAVELDEVKIATPLTISDAPILIAEHKGYCR